MDNNLLDVNIFFLNGFLVSYFRNVGWEFLVYEDFLFIMKNGKEGNIEDL